MNPKSYRIPKKVHVVKRSEDDNAYRITNDWFACEFAPVILGKIIPDYDGIRYRIVSRMLLILKTPDNKPSGIDGATGVKDKFVIDLAPGFIPHDLMYLELERHAADPAWKAAGWTEVSLRKLWDGVFTVMTDAEASKQPDPPKRWLGKLFSCISYPILRLVGGIYHRSGKTKALALAIAIGLILSGCRQWAFDSITPTGDKPDYTKVCKVVE
jgi:hypothetical protein